MVAPDDSSLDDEPQMEDFPRTPIEPITEIEVKPASSRSRFFKRKSKNLRSSTNSGISNVSSVQTTNAQVSNLIDTIEELARITKQQVEVIELQRKHELIHQNKQKKEGEPDDSFERSTVRLDGIEVYAVVSALTVASSIACLDAFGDFYGRTKGASSMTFASFLNHAFIASNAVGILTGLHATLIFSLVTMYGRTAVGLGRDVAFQSFFAHTGLQRYRGFQTFLWSLYAFIVQCIITIVTRMLPEEDAYAQGAACVILAACVAPVFRDTNFIIAKAEVIFDPKYFQDQPENRRGSSCGSLIAPPADIMNSSRSLGTDSFYFSKSFQRLGMSFRDKPNSVGQVANANNNANASFFSKEEKSPREDLLLQKYNRPQSFRDNSQRRSSITIGDLPRKVEMLNRQRRRSSITMDMIPDETEIKSRSTRRSSLINREIPLKVEFSS